MSVRLSEYPISDQEKLQYNLRQILSVLLFQRTPGFHSKVSFKVQNMIQLPVRSYVVVPLFYDPSDLSEHLSVWLGTDEICVTPLGDQIVTSVLFLSS